MRMYRVKKNACSVLACVHSVHTPCSIPQPHTTPLASTVHLCEKIARKAPSSRMHPSRPPRPRRSCGAMSHGAFGGRERQAWRPSSYPLVPLGGAVARHCSAE